MALSEELSTILKRYGAKSVGYGKLDGEISCGYEVGVSVILPVPVSIIKEIKNGPTKAYYDMYYEWNQRLDQMVKMGEQFLIQQGYAAFAQTTQVVEINQQWETPIPHKTVATRAGMGWIGKSGLLVTPEYGSAVRISSLLTNAPLHCNEPINESRCGSCAACEKACPAQAIKGIHWSETIEREQIVDVQACKKKQLEIMRERTGIEKDLCGQCFVVCPFTQKYVRRVGGE
ncbi:MAG: 4Fe-4S double cluster binding domain-containing protein [Lachnospiraceae bacterium]